MSTAAPASTRPDEQAGAHGRLAPLTLAALGVVYGDIGTSPLYTIRECFAGGHGVPPTHENVLGLLSLVIWSLIVVVTVKYVLFVLRADNRGEGGVLALMALAQRVVVRARAPVVLLGIAGASLFYGDSLITPAISVLSAVEGLEVAVPWLEPWVVPAALVIIFVLFAFQWLGTARVGASFGPIMLAWFTVLALLGLFQLSREPAVLAAINPVHAATFFVANGFLGFVALGAVVLAVTGAEALYADMGHFGGLPIRLAWLGLVLPALVLNYLGQGALVLADPAAVRNPFYLMAPAWALMPLIALATVATIIASQAVISGAFSLTRQAILLGYCPRLEIVHTSAEQMGQIYLPRINRLLLVGVVTLILVFESSSGLAAAYGIAVTGTMAVTTLLLMAVAVRIWHWPLPLALLVFGFFLAIDTAFLGSNLLKLVSGGWMPMVVGAGLFMVLLTWRRGRLLLEARLREDSLPLEGFLARLDTRSPLRVPGTAVYLTASTDFVPHALLHNMKHNKVLHERIILIRVDIETVPRIGSGKRSEVERLRPDVYRIVLRYGFMQQPNVPRALRQLAERHELTFDMMATSFFIGREVIIPSVVPGMAQWRERLFAYMFRNSTPATEFFRIPTNRVVELGAQVPI